MELEYKLSETLHEPHECFCLDVPVRIVAGIPVIDTGNDSDTESLILVCTDALMAHLHMNRVRWTDAYALRNKATDLLVVLLKQYAKLADKTGGKLHMYTFELYSGAVLRFSAPAILDSVPEWDLMGRGQTH